MTTAPTSVDDQPADEQASGSQEAEGDHPGDGVSVRLGDCFDPLTREGYTLVPNLILRYPGLPPRAKLLWCYLLSFAWGRRRETFVGLARMAADLASGSRTLQRALAELRDAGFLESRRRGVGKTSLHTLLIPQAVFDDQETRTQQGDAPSRHIGVTCGAILAPRDEGETARKSSNGAARRTAANAPKKTKRKKTKITPPTPPLPGGAGNGVPKLTRRDRQALGRARRRLGDKMVGAHDDSMLLRAGLRALRDRGYSPEELLAIGQHWQEHGVDF